MLREFVALFSAAYIYIYYYPRQARRLCTFVFSAGVYVCSMANGGQLVFLNNRTKFIPVSTRFLFKLWWHLSKPVHITVVATSKPPMRVPAQSCKIKPSPHNILQSNSTGRWSVLSGVGAFYHRIDVALWLTHLGACLLHPVQVNAILCAMVMSQYGHPCAW